MNFDRACGQTSEGDAEDKANKISIQDHDLTIKNQTALYAMGCC